MNPWNFDLWCLQYLIYNKIRLQQDFSHSLSHRPILSLKALLQKESRATIWGFFFLQEYSISCLFLFVPTHSLTFV